MKLKHTVQVWARHVELHVGAKNRMVWERFNKYDVKIYE